MKRYRTEPVQVMHLTCPATMHDELIQLASDRGISLNDLCVEFLDDGLTTVLLVCVYCDNVVICHRDQIPREWSDVVQISDVHEAFHGEFDYTHIGDCPDCISKGVAG